MTYEPHFTPDGKLTIAGRAAAETARFTTPTLAVNHVLRKRVTLGRASMAAYNRTMIRIVKE